MGMYHSTYFAYGFQIPDTDPGVLEDTNLGEGVGFLQAGNYDRDRTFLVTQCTEVRLGDHRKVKPESFQAAEIEKWNAALTEAAARLGVLTGFEPGWIVVPDMS
ncbi:hypothetical protein ACFUIV_18365 [Streptomyces anulatus]|uniref:hypothetical protein n=1 Tax=Streptomyces anulatus TaxID=1892 RepID=UPI003624BA56